LRDVVRRSPLFSTEDIQFTSSFIPLAKRVEDNPSSLLFLIYQNAMTSLNPTGDRQVLEAGLSSVKQGNYPEAIKFLERFLVAQAGALNHPDAIKAQMGLVMAYARSGRSKKAASLCRELNRSENVKVRAWATQVLGEIWEAGKQGSALEETDSTGFVPFQETAQTGRGRSVFVPPAATRQESSSSEDPTQPLDRAISSSYPQGVVPVVAPQSQNFDPQPPTRLQRWQPLKKLHPARLQWAEMGTAIALFGLVSGLYGAIATIPIYWTRFITSVLKWSAPIQSVEIPFLAIFLGLSILFIASPWLLDGLLKVLYGMKPLSTAMLGHYSPESHRLIQRVCQQQKLPLPQLSVLPTEVPLSFSYGCHPKIARIVVSQGLLDHLADDEIATLYASELGHILHWDFCLMSWVTIVLQFPYTLYWQAARAGNWLKARSRLRRRESRLIAIVLDMDGNVCAIVASFSYGLYWLLRWSGLWLSRQRLEYSDRAACNLTGNPNGLTRALLKVAVGTAQTIQKHQQTDHLLEGFDLLTPLGCVAPIHLGSLYPHTSVKSLLIWDQVNPDRHWLTLNNSHVLMGDRLQRITSYAHHWQLTPELDLEAQPRSVSSRTLLLQGAPFFGILLGYSMAQVLWFVAQILYRFGVEQITWLASDYDLFVSFMLLGFGLGTFLRFNTFFPDLQKKGAPAFSLPDLVTKPIALPIDSPYIQLEGTLIGRSGLSNWLGQDLMLQTPTGCIKLHYVSQFGTIGNHFPPHPVDWVSQPVLVTGWFRRGATPWIDADSIRTATGHTSRSGHQVWSTVLAGAAVLMTIVLIL
jgi:Zn-dependent protease with chaperone function